MATGESPRLQGDESRTPSRKTVMTLTALAVGAGAVFLILTGLEEPYHIDELRQVSTYSDGFGAIASKAFGADQPPLDHWLNALVQRAVGVGDLRQRSLPILWGIMSLVLIAVLAHRKRLGYGVPAAVMFVAISPALIAVTAYARPYALPTFLTLLFILTSDIWLTSKSPTAALVVFGSALLLPWSRTADPVIILGSAVGALLVYRFALRNSTLGSIWLPIGAAISAILLVGLPVMALLPKAGYGTQFSLSHAGQIWRQIPTVWADSIPLFVVCVGLVAVALSLRKTRQILISAWWLWVLFALPFLFAGALGVTSTQSVGYSPRWAATLIIPLGFVLGTLVWYVTSEHMQIGRGLVRLAISVLLILVYASTVLNLQGSLTHASRPDWEAVAVALKSHIEPGELVVFHDVGDWDGPEFGFAGTDRYLGGSYTVLTTRQLAEDASSVTPAAPYVIVTFRDQIVVPGWRSEFLASGNWLYRSPAAGIGLADALLQFSTHTTPQRGAALVLAAASIYNASGNDERACRSLAPLRGDPELWESIVRRQDRLTGALSAAC